MSDHHARAEYWLSIAESNWDTGTAQPDSPAMVMADNAARTAAVIAQTHALLAQDHNRCTATRGHANGHHYPAEPRLVGDWEEHTDPPRCRNCGHYEGHRFHRVTGAEEFHPYAPVTDDTGVTT